MEGKSWWTSAMSGGIVRWRILARLRPTACWRQSIIVYDDELPNSPPSRGLAPSLRGDMAGNVCLCPPRTCSLCPPRTCTPPSWGLAPSLRGDMAGNAASFRTRHAHPLSGIAPSLWGDIMSGNVTSVHTGHAQTIRPSRTARQLNCCCPYRTRTSATPLGHGNRFRSLPPGDG